MYASIQNIHVCLENFPVQLEWQDHLNFDNLSERLMSPNIRLYLWLKLIPTKGTKKSNGQKINTEWNPKRQGISFKVIPN